MEKVVIFDWGGVILKEYPEHYCDRDAIKDTIQKFNSSLTRDEAYQVYLDTLHDENGNIISVFENEENKYKWYERVKERGNLEVSYEEFINTFIENYKKIDKYNEVVEYIYSLKNRTPLALFSDLIFVCFGALEKQIDLKVFDKVFLSYEEGFVKSDIKAFENVQKKLGVEAEKILFVDNNPINIENAKRQGWNTCLAYGYELEKIKENIEAFIN